MSLSTEHLKVRVVEGVTIVSLWHASFHMENDKRFKKVSLPHSSRLQYGFHGSMNLAEITSAAGSTSQLMVFIHSDGNLPTVPRDKFNVRMYIMVSTCFFYVTCTKEPLN